MGKWKCEICGKEFENFHAQGFDNQIYCPLCYFKRKSKDLQQRIDKAIDKLSFIDEALEEDTLNVALCIAKINNSIKILKGDNND